MNLSSRIQRIAAIVCAALLMLSPTCGVGGFVVPSARAEQTQVLEITARAQPDTLTEAGEVSLYFTIVNIGDYTAKNVLLTSADGLLSEPVGDIAAGATQQFSRTHSVTAQELEAGGFNCVLSHSDPDNAEALINYNVWVSVSRSVIEPAAEFTRRFSAERVTSGESVIVTYNIRNTGNTALTDVTVTDDLGDYKGYAERIDVGESCTLINRAIVTGQTASHAEMTCGAEGSDTALAQTLDDVIIRPAEGQLNCILRAGYSAFSAETADVVMLLSATGDMGYHDLRITDETYGGVIADQITVRADGEPIEISVSCPVRGDDGFCWRVTGVDDAGNAVDVLSNVATLPQRENVPEANITMTAEALTPRIRRSGDVRVRVTIANTGGKAVEQLTLSEATQGTLREFVVLPADGTITRDFVMHVDDDTDYSFTLSYVTEDGATQTLPPVGVSVVIASDGVLPEGAAPKLIEFSGSGIRIAGSSTFAVLLIVGCALLLALIVLLLIASRKARLEKRLRAAQRQRRREAAKAKDKGRE